MYIASCRVNWIPESEKVWLWNLESWALKSGIPLTIEMRSPSFTKIESRIQYLKFGISQNSTLRKRKGQEGLREVRQFWKNRKSNKNFSCYVKRLSNKYGKNSKNNKFHKILHLEREKVKKGFKMSANFVKNRKSNKNFSSYVKRLSNKYGKNSKNNKFHKILHLETEKVKKGFSKSPNFAKIAKVTRIFHAMWKDWATNMAKITRITNFTKFYT